MLAHHGRGSKPCPLCDDASLNPSPIGHLLTHHQQEIGLVQDRIDSVDMLLTQLVGCNIQFLYKFRKLFLPF